MRVPRSRGGRQDRAPGSEQDLQGVLKRALETHQLCPRSPPLGGTGCTSSLSSSYSSTALRSEGEHKAPLFRSPSMSRRSLRLHTPGGRYGDDSLADPSLSYCETHGDVGCAETRTVRSHKEQQHHSSQSLLLTPRRPLLGSAPHAQDSVHSCTTSNTSLLSSLLDESCVQERTLVHSFWGMDDDVQVRDRGVPGDHSIHAVQTQTSMLDGYFSDNCTIHSNQQDAHSAYSPSPSLYSAHTHVDAGAAAPPPASMVYGRKRKPGVLPSFSDACQRHGRWLAISAASLVVMLVQIVLLKVQKEGKGEDCKGKRNPATHIPLTQSPVATGLVEALWGVVVNAGKAALGLFRWLGAGWYQLVALMSLLDLFILTRCLPRLYALMLLLLPLALILGLWQRDTYSLQVLKASTPEQQVNMEGGHTAGRASQDGRADAGRLDLLERHVSQLWESVQRGGWQSRRRQERLWVQAQVLARQRSLLEQLEQRTDPAALGFWVSELLERKLGSLREELQSRALREQASQERPSPEQRSTTSRLTDLEALLLSLKAKTEEVLERQASVTPPPISMPVSTDSEAHHSLLEKVQRLELELGHLRHDLQGALESQERCEQLERLQDKVSAQVKQELRMLFHGSEEAAQAEVPMPILPWLSARFTSGPDLQGALSALEHSILKNISLWVKQGKQLATVHTVSRAAPRDPGTTGMSKEEVELMVRNVLRLYSQDRTGLVDYALESGGGSILGTRCSETYETRSALMSLFGLPLWYFTQSPRVVIQPDVHPGNCWPFKGSKGFLVIRLSRKVIPTAFSLEHLAKALSPVGNISSAPRHFAVYGLENEHQDEGILLGNYTYEEDSESLQTFPISEQNEQAFQIIELRVLSNWGHLDYTCLYRFRVHGEPSEEV